MLYYQYNISYLLLTSKTALPLPPSPYAERTQDERERNATEAQQERNAVKHDGGATMQNHKNRPRPFELQKAFVIVIIIYYHHYS